jgi:peptidyl-prolyl cis-trans isomerase C
LVTVAVAGAAGLVLASCRPTPEADPRSQAGLSDVVATIGDYAITRSELEQRLLQEVRPQRENDGVPERSVSAESVLREMLAEKAMSMEGRALGYLDDEALSDQIEQTRRRKLIQMLLADYVRERVPVTPEEIDEQLKSYPEMTREQAEQQIQGPKAGPVLEEFYAQLQKKYKVEKVRENFAEAARIHQRLLTQPATPRGRNVFWIQNAQIQDDLTEAEKGLVLAKYEGGQLTLVDWFKALCQLAPPGRPKDLNTTAGVERLVDSALPPFVLVAEARQRGYEKDQGYLDQMREIEDIRLLGKVQSEKLKDIAAPTDEEIKAYFEAHRELLGTPAAVKVDQVWCKDLSAAREARKMLDEGASLESVKSAHSLIQNEPARNTYPSAEGVFWKDLWQAEPGDVVGPIRGFYAGGVKWRVVKILEKTPSQLQPYSDSVKNRVESAIYTIRRREILAAYGAELLDKYPYTIYADRIGDIDPLEVTDAEENRG